MRDLGVERPREQVAMEPEAVAAGLVAREEGRLFGQSEAVLDVTDKSPGG